MRLDVAARKYIGVPFLHQCRNPAVGLDCVGLAKQIFMDCGMHEIAAHDLTTYARNPNGGELERRMEAAFGSPVKDLSPGCLVTIDFYGQSRHVGIVSLMLDGRIGIIHAYGRPPRVVEHGLDAKWRRRITGIYEVAA